MTRRIRVLHLIPGVGAGGGAERSLVETAPGLRAAGIDLHVAHFVDRPHSAVERLVSADVPVHHLRAQDWSTRIRRTRALLAELRPDILHTSLFEADLAGRIAAARTGTRVLGSLVQANHDPLRRLDPLHSPWRLALVRAIEGATARHLMHHAVANSEAARWSAVRGLRVDPGSITVVHRGRSDAPQRPDRNSARRRLADELGLAGSGDRPEPVFLLNVGRHEFQKDHATAVEAVAVLLDRRPDLDVHLLVAGREGVMTDRLRWRVAALGLADRVHLLGARDDVQELLAAADAFVFPSILEGLPGALIEAMAAEVPIIATAIPAVCELLGSDDGILVAPRSPIEFADGIASALGDPQQAAERARSARRRYEHDLTTEVAVARTVALYRRLVEDR